MLRNNLLAIALLFLCASSGLGQEMRNCGTMAIDAELKLSDPNYLHNRRSV